MKTCLMKCSVLLLALISSWSSLSAAESDWAEGKTKAGKVRLISQLSSLSAQSFEVLLGLEFQLQPGWHVYWKNAGDVGLPPRLSWNLPESWRATPLFYPTPKEIPGAETLKLISYGYEDQVTYLTYLSGKTTPAEKLLIELQLDYLICKEQCIPESAKLSLSLPVGEESLSRHSAALSKAFENLPAETKAFKAEWKNEKELRLQFDSFKPDLIAFYSPNQKGKFWEIEAESELNYLIQFEKPIDADLEFVAGTKEASISGRISEPEGLFSLLSAELLWMLLIAFAGGLILNLMPCVLPVVIMKTNFLFQLRDKNESFRPSLIFTILGVVSSFLALGLITSLLREAGEQVGWGFQFQSPGFLVFLSLALFLFALNLFEVFEIQLPVRFATKMGSQTGAFFEGVFATLLATPCSAPFLGAALSFALTQSLLFSFLIFLFLGLGLAVPYIIFLLYPPLLNALPRPGNWMLKLKRFLGYSILFILLWLIYLILRQTDALFFLGFLASLVLIFICLKEIKHGFRWGIVGLLIALAFLGLSREPTISDEISQLNYTPEDFQTEVSQSTASDAYFLYITADWCFTCKFNEANVIRTERFVNFAEAKDIQIRKIDWTERDPSVSAFLDLFGRVGIPFAMLVKDGNYVLFPELMTSSKTEELIDQFLSQPKDFPKLSF